MQGISCQWVIFRGDISEAHSVYRLVDAPIVNKESDEFLLHFAERWVGGGIISLRKISAMRFRETGNSNKRKYSIIYYDMN